MASQGGQFMLGQYKIGKSIGEGTFGKVRLGIHMPTNQKVAVKTLQKQKIVEQADIERVTRQICILKILRHPNIIQLYEIIQTKTDIHLIMEYAEGGELFDYIVKKKRLDEKQAVKFMQEILSGVQYIHKIGIVHRDLKPENLLLDHNKNIKIVDFGLSNQYKPGQRLKTACGSPCYAAPEMIAGKRYECMGADLWSCGIILYAMLCGYLPFEDPNTNKLYKKIMSGQYETPKILSAQSKEVLKGILNTNPETRYKLQQIRDTKWYRQQEQQYRVDGIIVGKDPIQPNENLIRKMQKLSVDVSQIKNYIVNNRHNQVTAYYYLLKIISQRDPNFQLQSSKVQSIPEPKIQRRQDSPLIFRPNAEVKKEYYIPVRKNTVPSKENKDNSKNDSMNVSNIISSLVQANKNKIVTGGSRFSYKKDTNFDKVEEFKNFPNKKNSSIYEPNNSNSKGSSTHRSNMDDRSLQFNKNEKSNSIDHYRPLQNKINISISDNAELGGKNEESNVNKKRQELSDQLKQISLKIDKQIFELKKQNNPGTPTSSTSVTKKKESFGNYYINQNNNSRIKAQQNSSQQSSKINSRQTIGNIRDSLNQSHDYSSIAKNTISSHVSSSKEKSVIREQNLSGKNPKVHIGPFNTKCMFMENAKILLDKMTGYLKQMKIRYQQLDSFSLSVEASMNVSIQSIQGISGVHLIKFSGQHATNELILQVLSK